MNKTGHVFSIAVALVVSLSGAQAQTKLTYADLVARLYDLERLAQPPLPGERGAAWTSADRRGRYDAKTGKYVNWGANGDGGGSIRREGDWAVAAQMKGPGVIWRVWSARPQRGSIRIFIDGADKPAVDRPFADFFSKFGEEDLRKKYPNLAMVLSRGHNRWLPIPYQKSCKVMLGRGWGRYFHFTYNTLPAGTEVPSFSGAYDADMIAALDRAEKVLAARGADPHPKRKGQQTVAKTVTIQPGKTARICELTGPRAITALKINPQLPQTDKDAADVLRELTLTMKWDGAKSPQVWAPLGDFFATTPGVNRYRSLPMGMTDKGFYSYWYMPFATAGTIEIANDGDEARTVEFQVTHAPLPGPAGKLLRFHAKWHGDDFTGVEEKRFARGSDRWPDWPLLVTAGRGRYVGMSLHIWKFGGWWGEGDEKFFVDGEKYPSTIGTGSEDYIGYAWAAGPPFVTFESPFACNTRLKPDAQGDTSVNRFHVADDVPFQKSFEGVIEKYKANWDGRRPCLFDTVVYWYQAPGGAEPYAPVAPADRRHSRKPESKAPPPKKKGK